MRCFRIRQRRFERALRDAARLRGDADAAAVERRKRDLVSFAFVADAIGHRHFAIGEDQFAARGGADAEFLFFLADLEARRALFHDQRGDSFFALWRIGVHVDDRGIGRAAVGDPRFGAIDDVLVALLHRLGLQRSGVGARLRLGQRIATDLFAAREGQQEFLLLFVGSEAMNGIAVERILHRKNHAGRSAAARNLFDHDAVGDVIETRTALALRQRDARQAKLRGFLESLARESVRSRRVLSRSGFTSDSANSRTRLLQEFLIVGEGEVHGLVLGARRSNARSFAYPRRIGSG